MCVREKRGEKEREIKEGEKKRDSVEKRNNSEP